MVWTLALEACRRSVVENRLDSGVLLPNRGSGCRPTPLSIGGQEPRVSSFYTRYNMAAENATEHAVADISTFTELLENPTLAETYFVVRSGEATTVPEIRSQVDVSKKTAYNYVGRLCQAGLFEEASGTGGTAAAYEAEPFRLTLEIGGTETTVTPELVRLVARRDDVDAVASTLDRHGLGTLASFVELAQDHADGTVTTREIAGRLGLSVGIVYDLLESTYETLGLTGATGGSETVEPSDLEFEAGSLREELSE